MRFIQNKKAREIRGLETMEIRVLLPLEIFALADKAAKRAA